jgi:hypothetical protein
MDRELRTPAVHNRRGDFFGPARHRGPSTSAARFIARDARIFTFDSMIAAALAIAGQADRLCTPVRDGSFPDLRISSWNVRVTLMSRHRQRRWLGRKGAMNKS